MWNLARVLAFDVAAPVAAVAGLLAIGVVLDWPVWWVAVCSMLCLLVVEGVIVGEGVNRVVRHQRVSPGQGGSKAGGLITKEAAIHVSNVMLVGDDGKATRAGSREETVEKTRADGSTREVTRRIRIGRRSGKDV